MKNALKFIAVFVLGAVLGTAFFLYVVANYLGNHSPFGN